MELQFNALTKSSNPEGAVRMSRVVVTLFSDNVIFPLLLTVDFKF